MRDRLAEIKTYSDLRASENRPSGLTKEERGRLIELWNTLKQTPAEKKEMYTLQRKMR
jgi:hypothetical protein